MFNYGTWRQSPSKKKTGEISKHQLRERDEGDTVENEQQNKGISDRQVARLESQLEGKLGKLDLSSKKSNKELDKLERELAKNQLVRRSELFSKEKSEFETQLGSRKKELLEKHKDLELQDKSRQIAQLQSQLEEKIRKLETSNKERDRIERESAATRSELAGFKQTLESERQERRDLEVRALGLIKDAKRKWENAEKEKISQLNMHIEAQTVRITELCTSNNEMSSRLQRTECELKTANAELHKLRVFQMQYKESLAKTRELSRQSVQGVETKLEEISTRAHTHVAELRAKLDFEAAKNSDLEAKLRNEQDSNHCRLSRLNVALELAQNELKDCQEQLRSIQATIPARDNEIETLRNQLKERSKQLENVQATEQSVTSLQEQIERLQLENIHLNEQLQTTKSELNEVLMSLEQSEAIVLNLEQAAQDKVTLNKRLKDALEKEEDNLRKITNLEQLVTRHESNTEKLQSENIALKNGNSIPSTSFGINHPRPSTEAKNVTSFQEENEKLQEQLQTLQESLNNEKQKLKQVQMNLWKKEKELSDANLDKRIAVREGTKAEEKIKTLQEDKQNLSKRLNDKLKEEEEKSKKLLKQLDDVKSSLVDITKEASRNKSQADSAQRALTLANRQIEELQSSSSALRRELDATRKQVQTNQERIDNLSSENRKLSHTISKHNDDKSEQETKIAKLEREISGHELNVELLKETCTVLEEQLTDYEKLTNNFETKENMMAQEKKKSQKYLETVEKKLSETRIAYNEEKTLRMVAEHNLERLESETGDVECEKNDLINQRDQHKTLIEKLNSQISQLTNKCGQLECDYLETKRALESARGESRVVKEECSQHLTRSHELKEINDALMADLQISIDQGQDLRLRIAELENVLEEMRQFYQEKEVKAEGTRQQQTKLIDYLQLKLEECSKKKKTVCDKILGTKLKENIPPIGGAMPIGYRELENQLAKERAKVQTLTEQLLALKASYASASLPSSPTMPDCKKSLAHTTETMNINPMKRLSPQRIGHNIPHRFNVVLPMRAGKCSSCLESIPFGKRAAVCNDCQIMTHLKCSLAAPATCGLPGSLAQQFGKYWKGSNESFSTLGGSVQTLSIDQPDNPNLDVPADSIKEKICMESWVKIPSRSKSCWERKYLRLEGSRLCVYEHEPSVGMSPINKLDLDEKDGFTVSDSLYHTDVLGTAKSDLPFIFRIESNSATTCWPTSRIDIIALSQMDKKHWIKALKSITSQNFMGKTMKSEKYQTVLRLEKHQLDLNCAIDMMKKEKILLLGAEEGLFSYCDKKSQTLTAIRGVKKVHQLSLHPHLNIALMIAGENRQLIYCNLRQLESNALAAEFSRPAINTKAILNDTESCHLYQLHGEMLCAATGSHVILLKWQTGEKGGKFVAVRELETQEPCSCAIFIGNNLIVGCNKFFQININTFGVDEFPEEDDNSIMMRVAKIGIFPVSVLNISNTKQNVELLLCYNEFGVFVNEKGQRTRNVDPEWNHLPFTFEYRKPYLYIVTFASVEIIKIDSDTYISKSKTPERVLIDLSSPRYLGIAGSRSIYVATVDSFMELLKIDGFSNIPDLNGSLSSLDTMERDDDSSSEFSFTSSLLETLDGQGKRVHFANSFKN